MKNTDFSVLFEDDDVVVVDKSSGLLVIQDRFNTQERNLRSVLKKIYGEIWVVHRIDRETSGIVIFAKNSEAHRALGEQFEHRTAVKIYTAIVRGSLPADELPVDIPIEANPRKKGLMRPSARGKEAFTVLRSLERFRHATLVECNLKTGRQHQIRVHCSAIGHPLLVDSDYGGGEAFYLSSIKRKYNLGKDEEERPLIARVTLHAGMLQLKHPRTGELVTFRSELPKDMATTIKILRKYSAV